MKSRFSVFSSLFFLGVIVCQLFLLMYSYRGVLFNSTYDHEYWRDRYEHSQYQLPLTRRGIGDDGLYAYAGYRSAMGDDPFQVNNDKPPVGKYLMGFSILLFGNPVFINLLYIVGIGAAVYWLSGMVIPNKPMRLAVLGLLLVDPFLYTHIHASWLDLPQLFFFLLHVVTFLLGMKSKHVRYSWILFLSSGVFLGLFIETKTPIMLPILLAIEGAYVLKKRAFRAIVPISLGVVLGILLTHIRYFMLGHTIADLVQLQRYMIGYYRQSRLEPHWEALWTTVFIGKFPDIASRVWTSVSEWWIGTSISWFIGCVVALYVFRSKQVTWFVKSCSIFFLSCLVLFMLIPSYPRYLLLLLPLLYIFVVYGVYYVAQRYAPLLLWIFLLGGMGNTYRHLQPSYTERVDHVAYNLQYLFFHDLYQEDIVLPPEISMTREEFTKMLDAFFYTGTVLRINISPVGPLLAIDATHKKLPVRMEYVTRNLGTFMEDKEITLVRGERQWKLVWDWDFVLKGYQPGYTLQESRVLGKRGSIIRKKDNKVLVQDVSGYLISVDPTKIDTKREQELMTVLSDAIGISGVAIQNAYLENPAVPGYLPIGTLYRDTSAKTLDMIRSYPGVLVQPYRNRIYREFDEKPLVNSLMPECCTRVYSSFSYHPFEGMEKIWDGTLSGADGGTLVLHDQQGEPIRTIIQKEPVYGKDVFD